MTQQITLRISNEVFELLEMHAKMNALRPLTYASTLLTFAIRGQDNDETRKTWEKFKFEVQGTMVCVGPFDLKEFGAATRRKDK
jgi:hypothetical protein